MNTARVKALISRIPIVIPPLLLVVFYFAIHETASSVVIKEDERIYIVDRTGQRWDITQAVSLGFDPDGFDFGLGKNAFSPLDDSLLTNNTAGVPGSARVIGVTDGSGAKAYTISRLSAHEISNSSIGKEPVAVSY